MTQQSDTQHRGTQNRGTQHRETQHRVSGPRTTTVAGLRVAGPRIGGPRIGGPRIAGPVFVLSVLLWSIALTSVQPVVAATQFAPIGSVGLQPKVSPGRQKAATNTSPSASVSLLQQGPVVKQDGTYFVDVEVVLPAAFDDQLEVAATIHQRVKNRAEFSKTNVNADLGSVIGVSQTLDVNAVAGPSTGKQREVPLRLSLAIGPPSLTCLSCVNLRSDGVYPIHVELRSTKNETVVDRFTTYLVRAVAPKADPLKFALIVPLRMAPARDSAGEPQLPSTRSLIGFIEALVGRRSTPVTIAPTPETLDTLQQLEQENPTSSPLLDQIREVLVGREFLDVPFRPLSATLANDPRLTRLLEGNRILGKASTSGLLAPGATSGIGIYPDRMVSSLALKALKQTRVVVQDSALEPTGDTVTPTRPVLVDAAAIDNSDGVPVTGVVLDPALEDHFVRKLSSHGPGADDVLRAQHLIADLAIIQGEQPAGPHGVAVLVPESTSQATLSEVLTGMESKELVEPVVLSALFDLPLASVGDTGLVRTPIISTPNLPVSVASQTSRILNRLDGYRSAFQADALDANQLEKRLLVALSSMTRGQTATPTPSVRTAVNRIEDEANARIGTIRLSPNDIVTLTGRRQDVPIPIINDSGQPATVVLEVSSDNVSLDGSVADPNRPGQLIIRRTISIESRIHQEQVQVTTRGPGSFSMVLRLTTPSGLPLTNVRYTLRSTAVGGLGKILTIGALLVLGAWWIRSTVSTRRERSRSRHPATTSETSTETSTETVSALTARSWATDRHRPDPQESPDTEHTGPTLATIAGTVSTADMFSEASTEQAARAETAL